MSTVAEVLFSLRRRGVKVWSDGGQLHYQAPKGGLSAEERSALKTLKAEIMAFLKSPRPIGSEPPLCPRSRSDQIPLTFSQRWMWNIHKLEGEVSRIGVLPSVLRLSGRLDIDLLRQSFTALVHRHESLRTRVILSDGTPMQHVEAASEFDLPVVDLSCLPQCQHDAEARRIAEQLAYGARPAASGALFEAALLKSGEREHVLVIAIHHLISDGASIGILLRDLFALYTQQAQQQPCGLPEIAIQFADYAVWQQAAQQSWLEQHGGYWTQHLTGARRLQLVPDGSIIHNPATIQTLPFSFGGTLSAGLRSSSHRQQTTTVMGVLTAYAAAVMRCYDQKDIVIPFLTLGRPRREVENTIGFFGVPLFLRITSSASDDFQDLLKRVTDEYANASEHHDFCRIAALTPQAELAWNPTFNWLPREFSRPATQVIPTCPDGDAITVSPCDFTVTFNGVFQWEGELLVEISEAAAEIVGTIRYRADCFTAATAQHFIVDFRTLAQQLVENPGTRIDSVPMASPSSLHSDRTVA